MTRLSDAEFAEVLSRNPDIAAPPNMGKVRVDFSNGNYGELKRMVREQDAS